MRTSWNIALQCPWVAGDAVYPARALYGRYADSIIFFDDLVLCAIDTDTVSSGGGTLRELLAASPPKQDTTSSSLEYVQVFPNPAKNLLNLAYYAQTRGAVYFEMRDALGQVMLMQPLANGQTSGQFATRGLSDGLYYWRLTDSARTVKAGKVVIMQ
jgi:hypothetical protein